MNTETKPEWLQLHSPTPQASEPVAEVSEVYVCPDNAGKYRAEVLSDERLSVGAELFVKPQPAKPCERCAVWSAETVKLHFGDAPTAETIASVLNIAIADERRKLAALEADRVRYCPECGCIGVVPPGHRDCCPDGIRAVYVPRIVAEKMLALSLYDKHMREKLEKLEAENARLTKERNEAVNAVQRLSEGQPFEAIVIADAIKRATAQYEQTIAQQAEQLAQLTSRDLEVARTIEDLLHSKHSLIEQLAAAQRDAERWDAIETLMLLGNIELEQEPDGGYSISVDPIENITPFGWIGNTPEEVVDKAVLKFKSLRPGEAPIDAATAAREDVEQ